MSQGIGTLQRSILALLHTDDPDTRPTLWRVPEIAEELDSHESTVRRAVYSLERRGLVVLTRGLIGYRVSDHRPAYGIRVWLPERHAEAVSYAERACYRFRYGSRIRDETMIPKLIHTY